MTKKNKFEVNGQKPLRVLMVEDSEDDALLTIRELKKGGYTPLYERVETAGAMKKALQEKTWDIVLCDYKLPSFNAPSAIAVLNDSNIDIPLIIISGAIGEETAVECMRLGAQDYIMKDNLSRLCLAIARELEDAAVRVQRKQAEKELRTSEELFRNYLESAPDGVYMSDTKGTFIYGNRKCEEIIGYRREELIGKNFLEVKILSEKSLNKVVQLLQENNKGKSTGPDEIELISKEGRLIPLEINTSVVQRMGEGIVLAFVRDITGRKRDEEALRESENKYRLLADNIHDVIFVLDMNLNYTYVSPSVKILRGYEPEEVLKLSPVDTLTPPSWDLVVKTLAEVLEQEKLKRVELDESRTIPLEMRRKDGTTVWTEVKLSFIRDENKKAVGILGVTRDMAERKRSDEKLLLTLESLRKAFGATIQVLVSAVEARDPYTAGHQTRSADLARAIATEMGLSKEIADGIRMAGSIHDIGKLSIPAEILSKPTKLTNIEFSLIKEHPLTGYQILKNVESPWPLAQIVYQHHERMDGSGYPRNLKGNEIILEARIMAVADVVEAMASHRPYRPALGIEAASGEIEKNKGTLYDSDVADACLRLFREKKYALAS